jgi:hypothetical protein
LTADFILNKILDPDGHCCHIVFVIARVGNCCWEPNMFGLLAITFSQKLNIVKIERKSSWKEMKGDCMARNQPVTSFHHASISKFV